MKFIAMVIGLMLLASGCATTAGSARPSEQTSVVQSMRSDGQDFSSSPQYLEQRARQREINPYL